MKRIIFITVVFIGLSGCCSYKNAHIVRYWENEIMESLGNLGEYSVYDFQVPFKGVMDNVEHLPAWYKILLPPKKDLKKYQYPLRIIGASCILSIVGSPLFRMHLG